MVNQIQAGRYNLLLQRLLSLQEGIPPAPTIGAEIFSNLVLENDRPEWKFLAGERLCSGYLNDAAVASKYSCVGLYHPGTAGLLVVVEQIWIKNNTGGLLAYQIKGDDAPVAYDATGSNYTRDNGFGWSAFCGAARMIDETDTTRPGDCVLANIHVANATVSYIDFPVVMRQEGAVWVCADTVQKNCEVTFLWRERYLENSETP